MNKFIIKKLIKYENNRKLPNKIHFVHCFLSYISYNFLLQIHLSIAQWRFHVGAYFILLLHYFNFSVFSSLSLFSCVLLCLILYFYAYLVIFFAVLPCLNSNVFILKRVWIENSVNKSLLQSLEVLFYAVVLVNTYLINE